jgi:peptide/nickel transport system substrate-binding protein
MHNLRRSVAAAALMLGMTLGAAHAQEFRLAMSSPPSSIDPHFFNLFSNINVSDHMFETLVKMDPDSKPVPGLAESWRLVDDTTWEFKLRRGVKFHDGSEFTAEDVAWSIDRIPLIANSPGRFDSYTKAIISKQIVDRVTVPTSAASMNKVCSVSVHTMVFTPPFSVYSTIISSTTALLSQNGMLKAPRTNRCSTCSTR